MNTNQIQDNQVVENIIDIKYLSKIIKKNWHLFAISTFVALLLAFMINKFKTPVYQVTSSILINEESNSVAGSSAQLLQELGIQGGDRNFANEMLVLKSYEVIEQAIEPLDLEISYFQHEFLQAKELYKSTPFLIVIKRDHPQPIGLRFFLKFKEEGTVSIKAEGDNVSIYSFQTQERIEILPEFSVENNYSLNNNIKENNFDFKIFVNENFELQELSKHKYSFVINPKEGLINDYLEVLKVQPPDVESTVAQVSMETTVPEKGIDFMRALTQTYLDRNISQKRHFSQKTIEYINDQLNVIKDSLELAEQNLQRFRSANQILDLSMQSEHVYSELRDLEEQRAQIQIKQKYFDYIKEYFSEKKEYSDLITPSAMGIDDPMLNNLIQELISLNAERNSFIENDQDKSPYLKKINIRIDNLRNMISENINYIEQTTNISYEDLSSRIRQINNNLRELPETERKLVGMERKFNVNDAIYTYLLQKKAEAEIAKASYQADAEIIIPPSIKGNLPVAPKKKLNYALALLFGLLLPMVYLRVIDLVRKTIEEPEQFEKISNIPLLGKVYHNNKDTEAVVRAFPKSHIAESFRMLSLNLGYFNHNKTQQVIGITSTISGEGKSFVSLNLAQTLADNGHKCVLVGYDIRKPRDYATLGNNVGPGLSSYLSNQCSLDDIILHTGKQNLDCILAGSAPPNPFELIASSKTDDLIMLLKETYDYIILDTPPIGVVSDGYILMEKADLSIFIVRLKRTLKREFDGVLKEIRNKNLRSVMIINDIPLTKTKRYGYGYYEDK